MIWRACMQQAMPMMSSTNGGVFTDVYRAAHGLKKGAYTYWSQASGAEEFNYGTCIDLILAAGSCTHTDVGASRECKGFTHCSLQDCDIMVELKRFREDSVPRWTGGRTMKLEGSDHAPVFLLLKEQPPVKPHDVPTFAVRFLPQLRGRQQSMYAVLKKRDQSMNEANTHLPFEATQKSKKRLVQKTSQTNVTAFFAHSLWCTAVSTKEISDKEGSLGQSQEVVSQDCKSCIQEDFGLKNETRGFCSDVVMQEEDFEMHCNIVSLIKADGSTDELMVCT
ncbi:hypothetical protein L7F22_039646 [Adiantum nelumboides]|nr:hypothetical protein [Adiantum nelumboides]